MRFQFKISQIVSIEKPEDWVPNMGILSKEDRALALAGYDSEKASVELLSKEGEEPDDDWEDDGANDEEEDDWDDWDEDELEEDDEEDSELPDFDNDEDGF